MFPACFLRNFLSLRLSLAALCIGYYCPAHQLGSDRPAPSRFRAAGGPATGETPAEAATEQIGEHT
jgi:hypothetical protein